MALGHSIVQGRSSVVAKLGRGLPNLAQNTKETEKIWPRKEKKLFSSLGQPTQKFGWSSASIVVA
jgi:hypothetical protein